MSMGTTKTDPALRNATVDDPACIKAGDACPAFLAAHQLSQKKVSYYQQYDYGHYVSWYLLATLGAFLFAYGYRKWIERKRHLSPAQSSKGMVNSGEKKTRAMVRYVSYRRMPGKLSDMLGMPTAGITILILLFTLYCFILSFAVRPYYRAHRGYGSPPLAIRTGLMAIALTPWIVALSGKANLITMLTGIGHEKLNVMHRWIGRICLGLSVVHTIPFIVAPLRDGGYAALNKQFYKPGGFEYTGVPPLAMLFGIVVLSIPWLRHRFYEAFYYSHFLLAISYIGLMFWHAGNEGDSWIYLWITIAIWLFTMLVRVLWFNRALNVRQPDWFQGFDAELTLLLGNVTKIEVLLPEDIQTRPGQHFFLRFPAVSLFDNHPFTLAWTDSKNVPTLTFFVRSRKGFTTRLFSNKDENAQEQTGVWIDGPYGGIDAKLERSYDHMILVAGGIGITGCLPWLQHMVNCQGTEGTRISSFKLVWVVHEASHIEWIDEYLQSLHQSAGADVLTIEIYYTSLARGTETLPAPGVGPSDLEKAGSASSGLTAVDTLRAWKPTPGRPNMNAIIGDLRNGKVAVIGCGPTSLKVDLSNACANAQLRVLKGDLEELTLHTEAFGW